MILIKNKSTASGDETQTSRRWRNLHPHAAIRKSFQSVDLRCSKPPTAALQQRNRGAQPVASTNVHAFCVGMGTPLWFTVGIVRWSESNSFHLARVVRRRRR